MSQVATISSIRLYPIKSLDPVEVGSVQIGFSGSLLGDRRFALFDSDDKLVNGKREPALQRIRCEYDTLSGLIRLSGGPWLHLSDDRSELESMLSQRIGYRVFIREDSRGGLLDDPAGSHLTIISKATLEQVSEWFGWRDLHEARLRFRANLEIDGVPAFWEDRLFLPEKQPVSCSIGEVDAFGRKPCPRCPVPARDPYTGISDKGFQKKFESLRRKHLPSWSALDTYPHGYYLATTIVVGSGQEGKSICCGEKVALK